MVSATQAVFDALARALGYCLLPRVMALSLLPLVVLMVGCGLLTWLYWEQGVAMVREMLDTLAMLGSAMRWLESMGAASLRAVLAPLVLVALVVPVLVVACLMVVAVFMTPAMVALVARRRFSHLQRCHGASAWTTSLRSLGLSCVALLLLLASVPLWLVPPFVLLIPPLVWGWLAMQVMSFEVLAEHASALEREALMKAHRWPLLAMGILSGLMGAAPGAVWVLSALTLVLAPLVMMASIWLYTAVFALTSLWFAHYLLAALERLRQASEPNAAPALPPDSRTLEGTAP